MLVYHPVDCETARQLGAFLETTAPVRVPVDEGRMAEGETLADAVERALQADAVVALLSPESVAHKGSGPQWEKMDLERPVASLLLRQCVAPGVLRRHRWIDAGPDVRQGFRGLRNWVLNPGAGNSPATSGEIEELRLRISDQPGQARVPAGSNVVRRFATSCAADFEHVIFLEECEGRYPENVISEVSIGTGLRTSGSPERCARQLRRGLRSARVLLALDGIDDFYWLRPLLGDRCSLLTSEPSGRAESDAGPVIRTMRRWVSQPDHAVRSLPHANLAFDSSIRAGDWAAAAEVGRLCFLLLKNQDRLAEAFFWLERLSAQALRQGDRGVFVEAESDKAWILDAWGESTAARLEATPPGEQLSLF